MRWGHEFTMGEPETGKNGKKWKIEHPLCHDFHSFLHMLGFVLTGCCGSPSGPAPLNRGWAGAPVISIIFEAGSQNWEGVHE